MPEQEWVKAEMECIGDINDVDCPIEWEVDVNGTKKEVDGWLLSALEQERIVDARNSLTGPVADFYSREEGDMEEQMRESDLSPFVVAVHGVLLYRTPGSEAVVPPLIPIPTTVKALQELALRYSLRHPILLTSAPSAGKSLLISYLASLLHPGTPNQVVSIHLADTSLDPRALLGSYVSSPLNPGTFEWKEGVLVRAMREGRWIVLEDIDRASNEVLGIVKPLVESLGVGNSVGALAHIDVPSRGTVEASEHFALFATRSMQPSKTSKFPKPVFYGAHKWHGMVVDSPDEDEMRTIVEAKFPRIAGPAARGFLRMWAAVKSMRITAAANARPVGLRELELFCRRIEALLPSSYQPMQVDEDADVPSLWNTFPHPQLREDMYLEARDVFFSAAPLTAPAQAHQEAVVAAVGEHLGLTPEKRHEVLKTRVPEFNVERDVNGNVAAVRAGRVRLPVRSVREAVPPPMRPFAMHRPAVSLLSRVATAVSLGEPVLLTGETGTGKTSAITHLSALLRRPLISLNLSHQTESSDLVGGFKPVDARVPAVELQERFLELFGATFSRKRNEKFEESVRKALGEGKWKRTVALWGEAVRLARDQIEKRRKELDVQPILNRDGSGPVGAKEELDSTHPRKRRRLDKPALDASEGSWETFSQDVRQFDIHHVQGKGKFAFAFVEGPLTKALRCRVLLDEVNLASPETLECISGLLQGPTASITLTEHGSLEPVPRHPDFRLFACMNPATDVGKKDLPPNIRSRFTEIDVPAPDRDRATLLDIVSQYIGAVAVGDKGAILDVAEFYTAVNALARERRIADGSNHRPHYSMRTLSRALTFAADITPAFGLRRSLWEGCMMAFTMVLDEPSLAMVTGLAELHLLKGVRNVRSMLMKEPAPPANRAVDEFVRFGPFYLERGPLPIDPAEDYIITPSVERKLVDLARVILTRRFPVLIEGPTSAGKTSSIEYLAKRTGHHFVRINNHEHTDIQEYLGAYVSDPSTGKLVFKDGLLVRALREGHWIVLDELNLASTDVLEALNRLLDDNRELVIPETQEVVRPHSHFMLFATQNPPGLYAGRKVLSRAFRNRFLEVHFQDVPQTELETILCERCRIAPSYSQRIVTVFQELQKRRQSSRVFESKHSFATLRDLFRWAGRDAVGYQELAENGYMLLAERARRDDDKAVVKEVIESVMRVRIDEESLYYANRSIEGLESFIGCPFPSTSSIIWTKAMRRLFILVARALRFHEPILLVGETGSGKTSVCQVFANAVGRVLQTLNCHQNTETADLIGGLRPLRNRTMQERQVIDEALSLLSQYGMASVPPNAEAILSAITSLLKSGRLDTADTEAVRASRQKLRSLGVMFQWHDGPLVEAMRAGQIFLLDEISLADDSVLERLNSVLEPARTIVLAERGDEAGPIRASEDFELIATMNPGGDYGKKELSPALRNRFTEVWVPPVNERPDLALIINHSWKAPCLTRFTGPLLDFVEWLGDRIGDRSVLGLRDILAWVQFSNTMQESHGATAMSPEQIFHHGAHMTVLDGLVSWPQLSTHTTEALQQLRDRAESHLQQLVPLSTADSYETEYDMTRFVQLGPFALPRGPSSPILRDFNLRVPTTRDNAVRITRAFQVQKPILLEGSPGVGKTSLIAALANISGHHLHRINLSDQTDLVDLFGSDLPVEGAGPGDFAWRDGEFLTALKEGHWVLLDEMNLASQTVLEGLNSVLDHRGTVYIPELGRSFLRHPAFRIFAAQNPLRQGGGRKGLPKSFVNRFTKVYVEELAADDMLLVCQHLFPNYPAPMLHGMIKFNTLLVEEVVKKRSFARDGHPWEFNLRDVVRWASLLGGPTIQHPVHHLRTVYLSRFRSEDDRLQARKLFETVFPISTEFLCRAPGVVITPSDVQIGHFYGKRSTTVGHGSMGCATPLQAQLTAAETMGLTLSQRWPVILQGALDSGKTSLTRAMARLIGGELHELSVSSSTDTTDILGSFEQVDKVSHSIKLSSEVLSFVAEQLRTFLGTEEELLDRYAASRRSLQQATPSMLTTMSWPSEVLDGLHLRRPEDLKAQEDLMVRIRNSTTLQDAGRFEWVDGPLVTALKQGHWLLLSGANLCNPSVLDRLNALCEPGGVLTLSERGQPDGATQAITPHPDFRLVMAVDWGYGELSRAMRNRGIEISLISTGTIEDDTKIRHHSRLPTDDSGLHHTQAVVAFEAARRCLVDDCLMAKERPKVLIPYNSSMLVLDGLLALLPTSDSAGIYREDALLQALLINAPPGYRAVVRRFLHSHHFSATFMPSLESVLKMTESKQFSEVMSELRERYARQWGLPVDVFAAQPMDFFMHNLPRYVCGIESRDDLAHRHLLSLSRILTNLHFAAEDFLRKESVIASARISGTQGDEDRAREEIKHVVYLILQQAEAILAGTHGVVDVELVMTHWILENSQNSGTSFENVVVSASTLKDLVFPKRGLGLTEIWSAMSSQGIGQLQQNMNSKNTGLVHELAAFSGNMDTTGHAASPSLEGPIRKSEVLVDIQGTMLSHSRWFDVLWQSDTGGATLLEATQLKAVVDLCRNTVVTVAAERWLTPTLDNLAEACASREIDALAIGHGFLSVSRFFLELYFPDRPIDPAEKQHFINSYWQQEVERLAALLDMQARYELKRTGNKGNSCMDLIRSKLDAASGKLMDSPAPIQMARRDPSRMRGLWMEASQFLAQVASVPRIDSLLDFLGSEPLSAASQEQVVQESIRGFLRRLDNTYAEYGDVCFPLRLALSQMQLGLRLIAHERARKGAAKFKIAHACLGFPTVCAVANIRSADIAPSTSMFSDLVLRLSALAFCSRNINDSKYYLPLVESIYEQSTLLWSIDKVKEQEQEAEKQSLYRRRRLDHDPPTETEVEEAEFNALFPTYDDIDAEPLQVSAPSTSARNIDEGQLRHLLHCHYQMFEGSPCTEEAKAASLDNLREVQAKMTRTLFDAEANSVPDGLDDETIPRQMTWLQDRLRSLRESETSGSFNFYLDANVPEIRKAADVIKTLLARLDLLIIEWPDQMVLQHIRMRCRAFLALNLQTPVAKALSFLEHLLSHTEDWEMFSNKENSIKTNQRAITELIVEWRRLELSCWKRLLESQASLFAAEVAPWWFRLYDALIRGPSSLASASEEEANTYLDDIIPLLDEYITSSPVGQYQERLRLLKSFGTYATWLGETRTGQLQHILGRTAGVVRSKLAFFSQFSSGISTALATQRGVLETEIRGFIKLASWRDVNVQALKQSAQRTHRQLYKITRKFRDVLRQPITALLVYDTSTKMPDVSFVAPTIMLDYATAFTNPPTLALAPLLEGRHRADPVQAVSRLDLYAKDRILPAITLCNPKVLFQLCSDIAETSESLAREAIPELPKARKEQLQKALLVRKRKAWSDLLKELRRVGFTSNLKPDTLLLQRNARWITEQPMVGPMTQVPASFRSMDRLLQRLLAILPEVRGAPSHHHDDLNTREIQRGLMFVESALGMSLQSRAIVTRSLSSFAALSKAINRLRRLKSSPRVLAYGAAAMDKLLQAKNVVCELENAVSEVLRGLLSLEQHKIAFEVPPVFLAEANTRLSTLATLRQRAETAIGNVSETSFHVLLEDDMNALRDCRHAVGQWNDHFAQWQREMPQLIPWLSPVQSWLVGHAEINLEFAALNTSPPDVSDVTDSVLISMQKVLALCPETPSATAEDADDNWIKLGSRQLCALTTALSIDMIVGKIEAYLISLTGTSEHEIEAHTEAILVFLDRYACIADTQLRTHSEWSAGLLKLTYFTGSILRTLATQGFCKPPETDSGGDGQGEVLDASGGVGLGAGEGADDVSKEIEDESQVEGLQGDDPMEKNRDGEKKEDDAVEMGQDFEGDLQDVEENEDDREGSDDDHDDDHDLEEKMEDLDASDPDVVDERLWGDEQVAGANETDDRMNEGQPKGPEWETEISAKEQERERRDRETADENDKEAQPDEAELPEEGDSRPEGAAMDDYVQDAEVLDLPDDIDMEKETEKEGENDWDPSDDGISVDDDGQEAQENQADSDIRANSPETMPETRQDVENGDGLEEDSEGMDNHEDQDRDQDSEEGPTAAKADLKSGDGSAGEGLTSKANDETPATAEPEDGQIPMQSSSDDVGCEEKQLEEPSTKGSSANATRQRSPDAGLDHQDALSLDAQQVGAQEQHSNANETSPPVGRRLAGDVSKEVLNRAEDVQQGTDAPSMENEPDRPDVEMEYVVEDDQEHRQALGPAQDDEAAKIRDLRMVDEHMAFSGEAAPMDVDEQPSEPQNNQEKERHELSELPSNVLSEDIARALTRVDVYTGNQPDPNVVDEPGAPGGRSDKDARPELLDDENLLENAEAQLRQWQADGQPVGDAERLWRTYESLTHDLSYSLCEQLRLILEPTMATRLKGDYRTGKRLNMKKIIPYIASDYTKDKIWLRRTRPSQREYQVMIALDDSRSMAESHSVHLAFQTLALVSKALDRLEVGDVGVARFGEAVEILHDLGAGTFSDQEGIKVMQAFRFNQRSTNVLQLLEASLRVLEQARERRAASSSSAADLWQLEIIISDGICQDHDRLRTLLRKAEEQRVMIVFIILDSLKSNAALQHEGGTESNSIVSMTQVAMKTIDGRVEMQMERYLDTFPFEYYLVLRSVEALPDILSGTLRQFFERISEA
ncbi:P-loop containing nucleoside triphosphate hydrolase protein [Punctularia strigosozonata HHB-11173 SS5]|uniref:P-loop containing nucleoside triphosphate hydrolase protein n=1 Tax=Punctularia strigosozonata (strain HHB-11173) TaxID=741275 RepID=UPI0004418616|nr:P-loop containing nucleoside triphosphate hydrolase protein [Punctularia strigosozonata HHB-11173 SS5]EIN12894.1 P-loop containing nucleoside triphosphate hydrolase protein [Punctularia strigosozonata HHB-11173 SS5]